LTALKEGQSRNAKIILDPAPPMKIPEDILRHIAVIKPNAHEAKVLTGIVVRDRESARRAAEKLLKAGVESVIVGVTGEGDLVARKDGELWLPRIDVEEVDPTGAGDALLGSLAAFLSRGMDFEEAIKLAHVAAGLSTTEVGALPGMPHLQYLEEYRQTHPEV
jgi:ribokinase